MCNSAETPEDREYRFQERAGIMEFEGEMSRDEAEAKAWEEIFKKTPTPRSRG